MLGLRVSVHSIGHAISLRGLAELRKWVSLLAMARLGADKPAALVASKTDLFLLGLFSHMDAILDQPLAAQAITAWPAPCLAKSNK